MSTIKIYKAAAEDAEIIHLLIVALAVYEKEPQAVLCSVEELREQLQQDSPPFHCYLADSDGVTVGFALYFFSYSTWRGRACLYLEDLFVVPKYRRKGIGEALMKELAKTAKNKGCPRMEWSVLNWNQLALDFYRDLGAIPLDEWTRYRLDEAGIKVLCEEKSFG
jgi:GNAT superfamily N-acetyltransferase